MESERYGIMLGFKAFRRERHGNDSTAAPGELGTM